MHFYMRCHMYNKMNFQKFQKRFSTENRCIKYLIKKRWPKGFVCPHCQSKNATYIKSRRLFQCNNTACRKQTSITAGTIFEKTRTPLKTWFWMIFLITHHKTGISTAQLQRFTGIKRYQTCWLIAQKLRKAMADRNSHYQLEGLIETDDTTFGAKNVAGKRGRGAGKKTNVVVSVKLTEDNHPVFTDMTIVDNLQKETVKKTLDDQIQTGQQVTTDGYKSYTAVRELGHQHQVKIIGHPKNASKVLPWVHIVISNIKSSIIGARHGVSAKYLKWYLSEYVYLFNRRFWFEQLFDRLLTACLLTNTITFAELTV